MNELERVRMILSTLVNETRETLEHVEGMKAINVSYRLDEQLKALATIEALLIANSSK